MCRRILAKADVIFITIGSNDLLNECKRVVQEILKTDTKFKSADEALASLKEFCKEESAACAECDQRVEQLGL